MQGVQARARELKAQGRSADDTATTVQTEFQAKHPEWPRGNGLGPRPAPRTPKRPERFSNPCSARPWFLALRPWSVLWSTVLGPRRGTRTKDKGRRTD